MLSQSEQKVDNVIEKFDNAMMGKADAFEKELESRGQNAKKEFTLFEEKITKAEKTLASDFGEKVSTSIELSEKVRDKLNELGEQVYQTQLDMEEIKTKGVGTRNRMISLLLVMVGIGFSVSSLYLFIILFEAAINVDTIIVTVVMALIGVTMLFVSTII